MNMHSVIITPRLRPVHKRSHLMYILGKIPQGLQHHRDVEYWGPPGFWHWISYQLLYPGQPTAWGSPLWAVLQLTLLNLWFSFIHLQKESLRPDTSPAWNQDHRTKTTFLITMVLLSSQSTRFPISSLLVTKSCPDWCYLIVEGSNKSIEYLPCIHMSVQ